MLWLTIVATRHNSRDTIVSIASRLAWRTEESWFDFQLSQMKCTPKYRDRPWGNPHPPAHIQWVLGVLYSKVKWPGRAADHSPASRAEVMNKWSYNSTPPYAFITSTGRILLYLVLTGILPRNLLCHLYSLYKPIFKTTHTK